MIGGNFADVRLTWIQAIAYAFEIQQGNLTQMTSLDPG
jgi:hypothetical protein